MATEFPYHLCNPVMCQGLPHSRGAAPAQDDAPAVEYDAVCTSDSVPDTETERPELCKIGAIMYNDAIEFLTRRPYLASEDVEARELDSLDYTHHPDSCPFCSDTYQRAMQEVWEAEAKLEAEALAAAATAATAASCDGACL